jgi:MFS family permease
MLFWILGGVAVWLIGAIVFGALDGWFEYEFGEALIWFSIFWFVVVPCALPFLASEFLHKKFSKAKERQKLRIASEEKIRVAAEKELEKIEDELEHCFSQEARKTS